MISMAEEEAGSLPGAGPDLCGSVNSHGGWYLIPPRLERFSSKLELLSEVRCVSVEAVSDGILLMLVLALTLLLVLLAGCCVVELRCCWLCNELKVSS